MTENITVFIQNSIRITGRDRQIYIDPFQMGEEPHDADYIFITHDHYDHFSPEDIKKVAGSSTILIVPESRSLAVGNLQQMKKFYVLFPNTNALRSQLTCIA